MSVADSAVRQTLAVELGYLARTRGYLIVTCMHGQDEVRNLRFPCSVKRLVWQGAYFHLEGRCFLLFMNPSWIHGALFFVFMQFVSLNVQSNIFKLVKR